MPLTAKQHAFIEHFLTTWNAAEAARRAGYGTKANVQGSRMLANASVQSAMQARLDELKMTADEVLLRLAEHARGDMSDFLTIIEEEVVIEQRVKGEIVTTETVRRPVARLDLEKATAAGKLHLIKSYSLTDKGQRVELYDAQSALALLGKAHGLFVERQEVSGPGGKPIEITRPIMDVAAQELEAWRKQMAAQLPIATDPPT